MIRSLLPEGDMLDNAFLTGLIGEGEYFLLDNIAANFKVYERAVNEMIKEKGIITDEDEAKLRQLRINIYTNALRTCFKNKEICDGEKSILNTLKQALGLSPQILEQIEATVKKELKPNSV